jgi:hypothetical protein
MGWIGGLVEAVRGDDALDFVLTQALPVIVDGKLMASASERLGDDECYAEIFIEAIWLPKARKITGVYHGIVHAYSAIQREGEDKAKIAFVSSPVELSKVDPNSVGKVVTRSQRALGPIAWRGGSLDLELGLFSVKSHDLTTPFLDMISSISKHVGVSFVGPAASFMPLIRKGIELVTGAESAASLEIGLDINLVQPATGCYALIAADRRNIDEQKLSVDAKDKRLLLNGETFRDHPWLVFRIGKDDKRPDFGTVPDLKHALDAFRAAVRSRKRKDAEDALTYFRVTALTSPDLIRADAKRLAAKAEDVMKASFAGVMQSKTSPQHELPELGCLRIYD